MLLAAEQDGIADAAPTGARVLDLLRRRSGTASSAPTTRTRTRTRTLSEALVPGTRRRVPPTGAQRPAHLPHLELAPAHRARPAAVATVRTGDLTNVVTAEIGGRPDPRTQRVRRVTGVRTHITAVQAFRHFWGWLDAMGYASATVAKDRRSCTRSARGPPLGSTAPTAAPSPRNLGHDRSTRTDYYIEVPIDELREALTAYEQWLLAPSEPAVEAA